MQIPPTRRLERHCRPQWTRLALRYLYKGSILSPPAIHLFRIESRRFMSSDRQCHFRCHAAHSARHENVPSFNKACRLLFPLAPSFAAPANNPLPHSVA